MFFINKLHKIQDHQIILPTFSFVGYLMCIFEENLDETTIEKLQDFEFAVGIFLQYNQNRYMM